MWDSRVSRNCSTLSTEPHSLLSFNISVRLCGWCSYSCFWIAASNSARAVTVRCAITSKSGAVSRSTLRPREHRGVRQPSQHSIQFSHLGIADDRRIDVDHVSIFIYFECHSNPPFCVFDLGYITGLRTARR